jgi:hypothetical protein
MIDSLDRDVVDSTREIRRLYSDARRRLGLPPRQFVVRHEPHHANRDRR